MTGSMRGDLGGGNTAYNEVRSRSNQVSSKLWRLLSCLWHFDTQQGCTEQSNLRPATWVRDRRAWHASTYGKAGRTSATIMRAGCRQCSGGLWKTCVDIFLWGQWSRCRAGGGRYLRGIGKMTTVVVSARSPVWGRLPPERLPWVSRIRSHSKMVASLPHGLVLCQSSTPLEGAPGSSESASVAMRTYVGYWSTARERYWGARLSVRMVPTPGPRSWLADGIAT